MKEKMKECGRCALLAALAAAAFFLVFCEVDTETTAHWLVAFLCVKAAGLLLAAAGFCLMLCWMAKGKLPRLEKYLEEEDMP